MKRRNLCPARCKAQVYFGGRAAGTRYDIRMVTAYVLQNKKSRPPKKSKDGKQILAVPLSLANCPKLILPCNGGEPVCFYLRGVSALSCRRSGMSSRLCPAALHQTAALCKKGALRYCFPSKRFSMCTDVILTTFHCACQAQSLKKPIIFHRN